MSFAADIRDASRLVRFFSRQEFRALDLDRIVYMTMDGPMLVFDDARAADALALNEELYCTEKGRNQGLCVAYRRTPDPEKRKLLTAEIREVWSTLVGLAAAYTWPDADHYGASAWFEFAPDV